jgi:hypothetical protein
VQPPWRGVGAKDRGLEHLSLGIGDPIEVQPPWRGVGAVVPRAVHW